MSDLQIHWDNICKIYFLTKHYLLLSEEFSTEFDTFLQPIKEHRDAFDHITRVYGYSMQDKCIDNVDRYKEENMIKAVGHVYRAFFDTADWLSYICRKQIRLILDKYTKTYILEHYPDYENTKDWLNNTVYKIANIRSQKDISSNESELIKEVDEYADILNKLLKIHGEVKKIFE